MSAAFSAIMIVGAFVLPLRFTTARCDRGVLARRPLALPSVDRRLPHR